MNEVFGLLSDIVDLGSVIVESAEPIVVRWWRRTKNVLNSIFWFAVIWFVAIIGTALLPTTYAQTLVPIMALLPLCVLVYMAKKVLFNPIAIVAMAAFPKLRAIFGKLAFFMGIELAIGVYLAAVPISNDRGLLPLLVITILALFLFRIGGIGSWIVKTLTVLAIVLTLVFFLGGREEAKGKASGIIDRLFGQTTHPTEISEPACIEEPSATEATNETKKTPLNNPLNIKFGAFAEKRGGEDGGVAATDGGTFARFSTREQGRAVARELLLSENYRGLTIGEALRKWSNNGYAGEILAKTDIDPQGLVGDLSSEDVDILLDCMETREGGGLTTSTYASTLVNYRQIHGQEVGDILLPGSCFSFDWVNKSQRWPVIQFWLVNVKPGDKVLLWFEGEPSYRGPFFPGRIPSFPGKSGAPFRVAGQGTLRLIRLK